MASPESSSELSSWENNDHHHLRSREGSPFGKSRHNTPALTKRHVRTRESKLETRVVRTRDDKSETPSPLDHGYQTLEHSYDGDSSLGAGSDSTPVIRDSRHTCHILSLNDTLITRILSHVSDSRDLARVGATCSRLRHLAWQPGLWSSIIITDNIMINTDHVLRSILARLVWSPRATGSSGHGAGSVTRVCLSGCSRTSDRSLALIARNCHNLQRLELHKCRNVTNGGLLDLVTRCSSLHHLDLTGE